MKPQSLSAHEFTMEIAAILRRCGMIAMADSIDPLDQQSVAALSKRVSSEGKEPLRA